jgi:hypothetical protein
MDNLDTVYVLVNEGMPGLCKIGYTSKDDIYDRTRKLYTTGVPHAFEVYCSLKVKDGKRLETLVHQIYKENRVNPDREFFKIDPEHVKTTLSIVGSIDSKLIVNTNNKDKPRRKRLHNFTFSELNIPIGSILYFARNKDITCVVNSHNTVIYNGKTITLTEAARYTGLVPFKEIQGPRFWMYENELLTKRRKRIRNKNSKL